MMRIKLIIILLAFSLFSYGQLYINEFMASNASTIQDPDYTDDADWLELYNASNLAVNLNGYFLTDDKAIPNKWRIGNITIAPKGFAIFWADGKDSSNHTSFNLNALNEFIGLYDTNSKVIDSISYSNQFPDVSEGRNINNPAEWGYFITATPNAANSTEFFTGFALNEPQFNFRGGIYSSNLSILLSTDMGGVIRYTLDGSDPTPSSPVYNNPISLTETTVVRARIFKTGMIPGPIITNSYFINESIIPNTLPVVSLSTNPANFWDPQLMVPTGLPLTKWPELKLMGCIHGSYPKKCWGCTFVSNTEQAPWIIPFFTIHRVRVLKLLLCVHRVTIGATPSCAIF